MAMELPLARLDLLFTNSNLNHSVFLNLYTRTAARMPLSVLILGHQHQANTPKNRFLRELTLQPPVQR